MPLREFNTAEIEKGRKCFPPLGDYLEELLRVSTVAQLKLHSAPVNRHFNKSTIKYSGHSPLIFIISIGCPKGRSPPEEATDLLISCCVFLVLQA